MQTSSRFPIGALVLAAVLLSAVASHAEDWEVRMWRQMQKKVTLELVDTPLSEACELLTSITGMNIIIAPAVRQNNPKLNVKLTEMDAGTALNWFTQLTETHATIVDQAVFISDKASKKVGEAEKKALMELGAEKGIVLDLPPEGQALTDQDRVNIALKIMEKEQMKIQDFPGPTVSIDPSENGVGFKFGN
ncbi:MAG TPA: hypothetical protein VEK08_04685 [Planctomycetota bacterium]|nr:hypothetical protein [Planctomycetota bacterium]